MPDLKDLASYRKDILLAEVAAWLHNIGKLEPNFLVMQTGESPDIIKDYRIPDQYTFKRFCRPTILLSKFPYENLKGPLYFVDFQLLKEVKELERKVREIQQRLQSPPPNASERQSLGQRLQLYTKQLQQKRNEKEKAENDSWQKYEQRIEQCSVVNNWTLGSLLTLFWESEWFDKPHVSSFEPGSSADPDYQRSPKSDIQLKSGFTMDLPALLLLAHGEVSGQEKRGLDRSGLYVDVVSYEEQPASRLVSLRKATAFGYESVLDWKSWPDQRKHIIDQVLADWKIPEYLALNLQALFSLLRDALGDTQRPINEITLWDYSGSIAALFKAAVSQAVLLKQLPTPATMRWRLLSVRLDALDFLFQVQNVADLVARKRMLDDTYRLIEHLFKIEFPIGSPVYRDENGIVFVIPELPGYKESDLQQMFESLVYKTLRDPKSLETLDEKLPLYGAEDIRPTVQITPPRRGKKLDITEALTSPSISVPDPDTVANWWKTTAERCSVCGLRPEGYLKPGLPPFVAEQKARERHLCGFCLARRGRRSEEWVTRELNSTIWVDEVADINGRVALIIGRFAVDDWISGTLVRSMAIGTDKDGNWLAKPPTFARVHRIWRTTFYFWQEILTQIRDSLSDDRRRLQLYLDSQPDLGSYHVYELDLGVTSVSVVWVPPEEGQQGYLLSTENLGYIAKQLGALKDIYQDPALAAIFVEEYIHKRLPWDALLRNPEARSNNRAKNLLEGHKIIAVDYQDVSYATVIPILAEPRTFMALVPADKAVDLVHAIKTKYEREMGKVRNRLPLHLGIVFADSRQPLRTILDAGKRMLKQRVNAAGWKVTYMREQLCDGGTLAERFKGDASGQFAEWYEVEVEKEGRKATWYVPAVMGDGETEDNWYPYVFWERDKDGNSDPGRATEQRTRYYQAPNPFILDSDGKPQLGWLVHAGELQPGDTIYFTPASLDFIFLDHSGRRFEIAYDDHGCRLGTLRRPYLLDEIEDLVRCWKVLVSSLSARQIHQVRDLIEAKRAEWFPDDPWVSVSDPTFQGHCRTVLLNAEWYNRQEVEKYFGKLIRWAVDGVLADAVELFHHILKEHVRGDIIYDT